MITQDDLPTGRDFTVDEIVEAKKLDQKGRIELISFLKRLERNGAGKFTTGRKGHPSRFSYGLTQELPKPPMTAPITEKPQPIITPIETPKPVEAKPSTKERDPFLVVRDEREGIVAPVKSVENKDAVPVEWLLDSSFWDPEQRKRIAQELLKYRGGK